MNFVKTDNHQLYGPKLAKPKLNINNHTLCNDLKNSIFILLPEFKEIL